MAIGNPGLPNRYILYFTDSPQDPHNLETIAGNLGFSLVTASDPQDAITKCKGKKFRMVIVGDHLNFKASAHLAKCLRDEDIDFPIVLLSPTLKGMGSDFDRIKKLYFFHLPFSADGFEELIKITRSKAKTDKEASKEKGPKDSLPGMKILLVDDHAPTCNLVKPYFTNLGCTVEEVASGQAALDIVKAKSFHLVLMESALPDLTGEQVLKVLRSKTDKTTLPVIILSDQNDLSNIKAFTQLGINDFMVKPFELEQLKKKVFQVAEGLQLLGNQDVACTNMDFYLLVDALDRSLPFYRMILGENEARVEIEGDKHHLQRATFILSNGHKIQLICDKRIMLNAQNQGFKMGLRVNNFPLHLQNLKEENIPMGPIPAQFAFPYRGCLILDPDGNEIILYGTEGVDP